jgi:membrane protease YdiL (CAAX protease family)
LAGAVVLFGIALAIPWLRNLVSGTPSGNAPLRILVTIPLGTVLVEEFAFRGVLWGLLDRDFGPNVATFGSAALFGMWHVLAALDGGEANASLNTLTGAGGGGTAIRIIVTVLFTFAAGVLFAELRARSGSLLPAVTLHWAANGLGVLFVALAG